MRNGLAAVLLCTLTLVSPPAWAADDVPLLFPLPKHVGPGKWDLRIATAEKPLAAIVVPKNTPMLAIGAEEINKYVAKLGGAPLPVHQIGSEPWSVHVLIYLVGEMKPTGRVRGRFPSPPSKVPQAQRCSQAYLIRQSSAGGRTDIILAGYGEQGGLYAAVTFCHMLREKDGAVWAYRANVDDWPDFRLRGELATRAGMTRPSLGLYRATGEGAQTYMQAMRQYIDLGLHLKLNMMDVYLARTYTFKSRAYLPELTRYARARGFLCKRVFGADLEGKKAGYPECKAVFNQYLKETGKTTKDFMKLRGRYFCWSKDELLRRFARVHIAAARRDGLNMLAFHWPDTGDANWGHRCDDCRKRFGSDRVIADANLINLLHKEMNAAIPGVTFVAIVHPYTTSYLEDPEYVKHFTRLAKLIPEDVMICVRETDREGIVKWHQATRRPTYIYMQPFSLPYRGMLTPVTRTAKTLYFPERTRDAYVVKGWGGEFWHCDTPLGAQYAWNTDAPGATIARNWNRSPFLWWEFDPRGRYDSGLLDKTVPAMVRFVWGEAAAPVVTQIYRSGLHPWLVFDPFRTENALARARAMSKAAAKLAPKLTAADFVFQQKVAEKVCGLCLKIMKKKVPVALPILVPAATRLYKRAFAAKVIASVWQHYFAAREAVLDGKLERARKEIALARAASTSVSDTITKEVKSTRQFPHVSRHVTGRTMKHASKLIEQKLAQFQVPTQAQFKKSLLSPGVIKEVMERMVFAVPVETPPKLDGDLSDPCWKRHPHPVTNFVTYPFVGDPRLAADQSVVKVCYDKENLYVAFHLLDAGADTIKSRNRPHDDPQLTTDDVAEVILVPEKGGKSFAQFVVNAAQSKYDVYKRVKGRKKVSFIQKWNPPWQARCSLWRNGWVAEIAIPFSAFMKEPVSAISRPPKRGDRWEINLAREKRTLELSAIKYIPNKGFRAAGQLAILLFQ